MRAHDGIGEAIDFFDGVVEGDGEAGGGGDAETAMEWLGAMVAGAEADAFSSEDFREVVGVEATDGEGEAAGTSGEWGAGSGWSSENGKAGDG